MKSPGCSSVCRLCPSPPSRVETRGWSRGRKLPPCVPIPRVFSCQDGKRVKPHLTPARPSQSIAGGQELGFCASTYPLGLTGSQDPATAAKEALGEKNPETAPVHPRSSPGEKGPAFFTGKLGLPVSNPQINALDQAETDTSGGG